MSKGRPMGSRNMAGARRLTEEVVEVSHGPCKDCTLVAELGDGLCLECWDLEVGREFDRKYRGRVDR